MSLFQCENCGCVENTALAVQGFKDIADWFDWTGIEDRKGMLLCSACGPTKDENGDILPYGKWHDEFERVFLPKGMFKTNNEGNRKPNADHCPACGEPIDVKGNCGCEMI